MNHIYVTGTEEQQSMPGLAEVQEFLNDGKFSERKPLIRNFVRGIEATVEETTLTYTPSPYRAMACPRIRTRSGRHRHVRSVYRERAVDAASQLPGR